MYKGGTTGGQQTQGGIARGIEGTTRGTARGQKLQGGQPVGTKEHRKVVSSVTTKSEEADQILPKTKKQTGFQETCKMRLEIPE